MSVINVSGVKIDIGSKEIEIEVSLHHEPAIEPCEEYPRGGAEEWLLIDVHYKTPGDLSGLALACPDEIIEAAKCHLENQA